MTSCVTESPLTGLGRRRIHAGPRRRPSRYCWTSSSRRPGAATPRVQPSWCRSRSPSPTRTSRSSTSAPLRVACRGRPRASSRRPGASGAFRFATSRPRPRGWRATACRSIGEQAVLHADPGADPHPLRRVPGDLRAGRAHPRRGRAVSLSGPRRRARAARRRGGGALLPGRRRRRGLGLGDRARRDPGARRPGGLYAPGPRARPRRVPGPGDAHQPAARLGRDPDRVRAGAARATRPDRPGVRRRGDGGRPGGA